MTCRKCGYSSTDRSEFHRGCCWACVMGPWDEELDKPDPWRGPLNGGMG